MNVLELFAGIGGLSLGLERAGFQTVGQVEINPFCRTILDKHWSGVPKHDDVRTAVEWWNSEPRPVVDVVAGGFPCQGHSVAGKQRGTADERWGWPWYRDVVEALAPRAVLIENVPNLVRTGLLDVLRDLADLGFDAWWNRVPAAAVGAPHLRWRLFVIAAHPERVNLRNGPGWRSRADGQGTAVVGHDGATWALADADGATGRPEARNADSGAGGQTLRRGAPESGRRGASLADAGSPRLPQWPVQGSGSGNLSDLPGQRVAVGAGGTDRTRLGDWPAEPDVGRVVDGLSSRLDRSIRVDRIRTLGNACVPAVGEYIGRLLYDFLDTGRAVNGNAA